jgi:hypothetical protein
MMIQCCVCGRVRHGGAWVVDPKACQYGAERVSHGYCPACAEEAFEALREYSKNRQLVTAGTAG